MGWLIALAVLTALAWIPLGVRLRYDEDGPAVTARLAGVPVKLYPRSPKKEKKSGKQPKVAGDSATKSEKNSKAEKPKPTPVPEPAAEKTPPQKKGGSLADFLPLVKVGLDFLGAFRKKLRVDRLDLKLILAGDDPCDLAVNYGRAWAAVGNLLPRLEQYFVIKKRNIEVECDFESPEIRTLARVDLSITLGRTLALAAVYGFRGLKEFLNLKKRKGGAQV